jgi:glutamate synthase (NADPH) small chain
VQGVFAGGDIVTGAATVIEAMGAGRKAARSMKTYLGIREPACLTSTGAKPAPARFSASTPRSGILRACALPRPRLPGLTAPRLDSEHGTTWTT